LFLSGLWRQFCPTVGVSATHTHPGVSFHRFPSRVAACGFRSGIQYLFDPGWKFGPAINIPDLQHGRVGDETQKVLANSAVIVSHLFWIRNTRSLRLTSLNFYNLLLQLIEDFIERDSVTRFFASCLLFFPQATENNVRVIFELFRKFVEIFATQGAPLV
jgi:hypothetical protein